MMLPKKYRSIACSLKPMPHTLPRCLFVVNKTIRPWWSMWQWEFANCDKWITRNLLQLPLRIFIDVLDCCEVAAVFANAVKQTSPIFNCKTELEFFANARKNEIYAVYLKIHSFWLRLLKFIGRNYWWEIMNEANLIKNTEQPKLHSCCVINGWTINEKPYKRSELISIDLRNINPLRSIRIFPVWRALNMAFIIVYHVEQGRVS